MTLDSTMIAYVGSTLVGTLGTCIGLYMQVSSRLKTLEMKMQHMEESAKRQDDKYDQILRKLDEHAEKLIEVQLDLKDKQNRS
jgi:hypothetical protein